MESSEFGTEQVLLGTGLPAGELKTVLRYGYEETIRQGRVFAWQDDRVERCLFVLGGKIIPQKHRADSPPVSLPGIVRGGWAGLVEMISGATARADYTAYEETHGIAFSVYNLEALRGRPLFEKWLSLSLAREALSLHAMLSEGSTRSRIVSWLLSRKRTIAGIESTSVSATQSEIASSLGLTRETINKRLAELEDMGLVRTSRGEIRIPDWDLLDKAVSEE